MNDLLMKKLGDKETWGLGLVGSVSEVEVATSSEWYAVAGKCQGLGSSMVSWDVMWYGLERLERNANNSPEVPEPSKTLDTLVFHDTTSVNNRLCGGTCAYGLGWRPCTRVIVFVVVVFGLGVSLTLVWRLTVARVRYLGLMFAVRRVGQTFGDGVWVEGVLMVMEDIGDGIYSG